jgi:dihydrofolate reductase
MSSERVGRLCPDNHEWSTTMRTLIITEFISLDGVMQAPGGEEGYAHSGWVGPRFTDELGAYKLQEQLAADILLLGRVTYEGFYGAWPQRDGAMADKINTMTKVVASTTLESSAWEGTTIIGEDVLGRVAELKATDGGPILVAGSRTLAQSLLAAGLVDELNLQVFPLILGSGARLYPESEDLTALELVSSQTLDNGVLLQSYAVQPAAA